jgi:hypothetical protein
MWSTIAQIGQALGDWLPEITMTVRLYTALVELGHALRRRNWHRPKRGTTGRPEAHPATSEPAA